MSERRAIARTTATSSATYQQIDIWKEVFFAALDGDNISGRFTIDEGNLWLELEGDWEALKNHLHSIDAESIWNTLDIQLAEPISSRIFTYLWAYHEKETPLSTQP